MGGDNPFDEPEDADRTIIRPAPGGRKPASAAQPVRVAAPPSPAERASTAIGDGAESLISGQTPLLAAAAPLLQLLGRLRNTLNAPDAGDLRERTVAQVRAFEKAGRDGAIPMEQLRPAHYALCASLDDVVLATPWGAQSAWDTRSLVSTFHQEVRSGERFFDLLNHAKQSPGTMLPVLELFYLCLALGFQGKYRLSPRGPAELDRLREDLYSVIVRQRQAAEPALSPHWQGVAAPYRPRRASLPVWVVGVVALAAVCGLFLVFSRNLNAASDDLFDRMMQAPPAAMPALSRAAATAPPPPPPAPVEAGVVDRLRAFLKPEIDQGLVVVLGDETTPIVRIHNKGMFPSGSASVQPRFVKLLERIGTALATEKGSVQVVGHTDNQPIKTVQFPSNFHLSSARAQAARAILAHTIGADFGGADRATAEGRADGEPLASNATPDGREANRRIEIVLRRQG